MDSIWKAREDSIWEARVDMVWIEAACLGILALGLALRARAGNFADWLSFGWLVGCAALLAEDTCIRAYGFYDYAPAWHGWAGRVPLLVGVIWIFVVLSARDMARALRPEHPLPIAFLVIAYDAMLIEPIATHAGLWRWHEVGPFAVPWIGMLGWALFGAAALYWLQKLPRHLAWLTLLLAPLTTHALLLALWWGLLHWIGREQPEPTTMALTGLLVALALGLALWRSGRIGRVPMALVAPRIAPALFFFGLLALRNAPPPLWAYAATFALPWLLATRWRSVSLQPSEA